MPHYHLNIYNDLDVLDEEGQELPDLQAARTAACAGAREMIAEHITAGRPIDVTHRIEITDARFVVLDTIRFGDLIKLVNAESRARAGTL